MGILNADLWSWTLEQLKTTHALSCVQQMMRYVESLQCHFNMAQLQIISLEFGSERMKEGLQTLFLETREVMTKEKFDLALKGQLYIEDGKLKMKEA